MEKLTRSEARKATSSATSSGRPTRFIGMARAALPADRRRAHHRVIRAGHEDTDSRPEERPSYISAGAAGAVWQAKDLPMYLHIFAYMTRGALLNWCFSPTAA